MTLPELYERRGLPAPVDIAFASQDRRPTPRERLQREHDAFDEAAGREPGQ